MPRSAGNATLLANGTRYAARPRLLTGIAARLGRPGRRAVADTACRKESELWMD
jgi:hypothetical protein